jgi:hypothetical protein
MNERRKHAFRITIRSDCCGLSCLLPLRLRLLQRVVLSENYRYAGRAESVDHYSAPRARDANEINSMTNELSVNAYERCDTERAKRSNRRTVTELRLVDPPAADDPRAECLSPRSVYQRA